LSTREAVEVAAGQREVVMTCLEATTQSLEVEVIKPAMEDLLSGIRPCITSLATTLEACKDKCLVEVKSSLNSLALSRQGPLLSLT